MPLNFKPFFANRDDLLLGGHLLSALEVGRLAMHAADYAEIAGWVADLFERMDTGVLLRLRQEGPDALRVAAENALHERGEVDWTADRLARVRSELAWRVLCARMSGRTRT
jgi:hypothetical protein